MHSKLHQIFDESYLRPLLGPSLAALRRGSDFFHVFVKFSGFVNDMFAHSRRGKTTQEGRLLKVTHHKQHGFDTLAYTQTHSPVGSTGSGAESDVYVW